ncbi:MAG: type II toxin-antitoxin system death-on-curing family toxin [Leptonema illini]|jgi:death-on-curing protein|uniref:Type II toxin-antitoxin system death-on-curing family toxin n=1 Tax=Leptonema illini TaxID=183 RepID=A0A833LVM6_9LEPT|nr:MAG: type II toxin-antitoxin system death-on-curing family toxin [Leptonema illini]
MKRSIRWLTERMILAIHKDQINQSGGIHGIRDQGLLESALFRPQNLLNYDERVHLFQLAAAYGYGIARNHPFVDGNKRIAFMAMYVFLGLNGYDFDATEEDVVATMLQLAAGKLSESELTNWLTEHARKDRG